MLCELNRSELTYLLEESTCPFIDEGVALQVRERERMLLSLAVHADGYKMMVGTHNIIDVTVAVYTKIWKEGRGDSSSQDHVVKKSITCRSELADSDARIRIGFL